MKKRITPVMCDSLDFAETFFINGQISEAQIIELRKMRDRHRKAWSCEEELFVVEAILSQYSPTFVSRVLGRSTNAILNRLTFLFGHSRWLEISTMSSEARRLLLIGFREATGLNIPPPEIVSNISDSELFDFLQQCGFDGVSSYDAGA